MEFLKNLFQYFQSKEGRRENDESNFGNISELIQNNGFHVNEEVPRFGMDDSSHFDRQFEMDPFGMEHFLKITNEMKRQFHSMMGPDFFNIVFKDINDSNAVYPENVNNLSGESLRNYYLNNSQTNMNPGLNQNGEIMNIIKAEDTDNVFTNMESLQTFSQPRGIMHSKTTMIKVDQNGIAEVISVIRDENGQEKRIVKQIKLN